MHRPLSALLSQSLVAFTVESDNEFERRMATAGSPGRLSLVMWANVMRFLAKGAISVRELARLSLTEEPRPKLHLGSLERWGYVTVASDSGEQRRYGVDDGWGSGRGIRPGWPVHLTPKGRQACEIWRGLPGEIEERWRVRFGEEHMASLRAALESSLKQLDLELPHGVPFELLGVRPYPKKTSRQDESLPLPVLLSQALLAFAVEFDRESPAPLQLCANSLRVLSDQPTPVSDLPRLTGCSPETCGIGWQLKRYVTVAADPAAKRGKVVWLNARGIEAQRRYGELTREIEDRWKERIGTKVLRGLRASLEQLFIARGGEKLLLTEGLAPPEGSVRSGVLAPSLGRRSAGPAARQRMLDLVAQTKRFLDDPAGALPHFPMWDHNRGYGP